MAAKDYYGAVPSFIGVPPQAYGAPPINGNMPVRSFCLLRPFPLFSSLSIKELLSPRTSNAHRSVMKWATLPRTKAFIRTQRPRHITHRHKHTMPRSNNRFMRRRDRVCLGCRQEAGMAGREDSWVRYADLRVYSPVVMWGERRIAD